MAADRIEVQRYFPSYGGNSRNRRRRRLQFSFYVPTQCRENVLCNASKEPAGL